MRPSCRGIGQGGAQALVHGVKVILVYVDPNGILKELLHVFDLRENLIDVALELDGILLEPNIVLVPRPDLWARNLETAHGRTVPDVGCDLLHIKTDRRQLLDAVLHVRHEVHASSRKLLIDGLTNGSHLSLGFCSGFAIAGVPTRARQNHTLQP